MVLYFQRDGDTYHAISEIGTVQGDAASGIFFNAGLQRAFNQLRVEYPEALLAKYADDVNGAVVGTHTADSTPLRVDTSEDLAFIGVEYSYPTPLSHDPLDINPTPTSVPIPLAIVKRWQYLCSSMCGLRVGKKWEVSSPTTSQDEYGNVEEGGVPTLRGLDIAGVPIGTPEYVAESLSTIVEDKVAAPYRAVAKLSRSQLKHLLNANCGGTARVQHVWQAIDPVSSAAAVKATDELTTEALQDILGVLDTLPPWVLSSCFLPQRYGG